VTRTIALSVEQLYRPQPGGIATYVRGLAVGLTELNDESLDVIGLAPRGQPQGGLPIRTTNARVNVAVLTRLWRTWSIAVPRNADVVHATSMAGPFGGGKSGAVHSVSMHDLLWRDEPDSSTKAGISFHERRLKLIASREELRVIVTAPSLVDRLSAVGIAPGRVHAVRLGVDDPGEAASHGVVEDLLAEHGVRGPFTLYVGTREPRKNLDRLVEAHRQASSIESGIGRLVIVGPSGWGDVATGDATVLGTVPRPVLNGLYRDATVVAYVPRAEGWGLPPVEALHAGTRVVASLTTPSVENNAEVVRVDPLDVDAIAKGLLSALTLRDDDASRSRRQSTVTDLTWRNVALDHLAAWR
jgi:glycosyltransferase involved in cell wall biosynthesis